MSKYQQIIIELLKLMSQEELGSALSADQATISRWKRGNIPSGVDRGVRLMELAKQHGISLMPPPQPPLRADAPKREAA